MGNIIQRVVRNIRRTPVAPAMYYLIGRTPTQAVSQLISTLRPFEPVRPLIRVGPTADGGYLVPDDLDGIQYAFSPGVDRESRFEAALAERGMTVFMADYSVDGPAERSDRFSFLKKFIGSYEDDIHITFDQWIDSSVGDHGGDLLLQMDIEGSEYDVLLNCSDRAISQFRIIVLEVHEMGRMFERSRFGVYQAFFRRLLLTHNVVHIHPNNRVGAIDIEGIKVPHIMELTLYRKDRPIVGPALHVFPHELDVRNVAGRPDLTLPGVWQNEAPPVFRA